ncbi:hypothetical protein LEP1GSC168_2560 [Leptospira santarosai str. HAI134]|nr:hypothetical protein LEP1GSC169_2949 [Leptospira santarosai str. HAI1349]EMM85804.1 hypothetical protein LEP1GSC039_1574 [Leptospira santarosai str. 2000027870]EMO22067.1 hypothetical protein LEP1GSC168_2560 [Leptospira santarosai str. HAI134]
MKRNSLSFYEGNPQKKIVFFIRFFLFSKGFFRGSGRSLK